jgi:ATP-dependent DNA helicase DinG
MNKKYPILNHFSKDEFLYDQMDILKRIQSFLNSDKKVLLLQAPTGTGKSVIADTIINYIGEGYILTKTKQLEHQYEDDGYTITKGRVNFTCLKNGNTCDLGECKLSEEECIHKPVTITHNKADKFAFHSNSRGDFYWQFGTELHCPYWEQKANALNSPKVVHNNTYFLLELNFIGDFGKRKIVIADEGQKIEESLLDFYAINITKKQIDSFKNFKNEKNESIEFRNYGNNIKAWYNWLIRIHKIIPKMIGKNNEKINNSQKLGSTSIALIYIAENNKLEELSNNINTFIKYYQKNSTNWFSEVTTSNYNKGSDIVKLSFKPIFINEIARDIFLESGDKIILMSATFPDCKELAKNLGLEEHEYEFINDIESPFPAINTPIYNLNAVKLNRDTLNPDFKNNNIDKMVNVIDQLIDLYPTNKGIIHTSTHHITKLVASRSRHKHRLLTVNDDTTREEILKIHIDSKEPTILLSPSMIEGVNLCYSLCRFQIMVKVPFKNMYDPYVVERKKIDKNKWFDTSLCNDIIQTKGRGMRAVDDWCYIYTIDEMYVNICNEKRNDIREMLWQQFTRYVRQNKEFAMNNRNELLQILKEHPEEYTDWFTKLL